GDDLLGHHDAVRVLQRRLLPGRGVGDQLGQLGARCDLGDPLDRDDAERLHGWGAWAQATAASASRARAAATRASRIRVSATTARTPSASTAAASAASVASITRVLQNSRYARATPTHDTSIPSGPISRSAGPFTGRPPTIGLTPTTRSRRRTSTS